MEARVGILMGSDSDMPVMRKAADTLKNLGITFEINIISAHREPDEFFRYAKTAKERGLKVIIAGAGMAAHLPGMLAAIFPLPVIGIPMHTHSLGGRASLPRPCSPWPAAYRQVAPPAFLVGGCALWEQGLACCCLRSAALALRCLCWSLRPR